jgi:spore coat protein B
MNNIWRDRYKEVGVDTCHDTKKDKNKSKPSHTSHPNPKCSSIDSLKGKTVTIYKGGPESKSGKLLDVQSDYLTLYTHNKAVIYYQTEHVKSIIEDSKLNSAQHLHADSDKVDYLSEKNFNALLMRLVDEAIQINQGGPERTLGTLLGVRSDYLILLTDEDGILYVKLHHIKSISKSSNNVEKKKDQGTFKNPVLSKASYFSSIFQELEHKWVAINRGGPEATEGILVEKSDDYYTLINNEVVFRIHPFHIRSISSGPKGSSKQSNNENKENNNENRKEGKNKNEEKYKSKNKNKDAKDKDGQKDKSKSNSKDSKNSKDKDGQKKDNKNKYKS